MEINIPIWGLVNSQGKVVFYSDTKQSVMENKWHRDEKPIKLMIVERN